jgi:hypothetical protein
MKGLSDAINQMFNNERSHRTQFDFPCNKPLIFYEEKYQRISPSWPGRGRSRRRTWRHQEGEWAAGLQLGSTAHIVNIIVVTSSSSRVNKQNCISTYQDQMRPLTLVQRLGIMDSEDRGLQTPLARRHNGLIKPDPLPYKWKEFHFEEQGLAPANVLLSPVANPLTSVKFRELFC